MDSPYKPLRPKPFPADEKARPHPVDGLRVLNDLEAFLDERAADGQPAWFLIQGTSGSGQTTLAYHLLNRFGGRFAEFIVPFVQGPFNHDTTAMMDTWVVELQKQLMVQRLLTKEMQAAFADHRRKPREQRESDLPLLMVDVKLLLEARAKAGLGVLFDQARQPQVLRILLQAFDGLPAAVVATVDPVGAKAGDWVPFVENFAADPRTRVVELGTLTDSDMLHLAVGCWKQEPASCPFTKPHVEEVFRDIHRIEKRLTVRRGRVILAAMHELLEGRAVPYAPGDLEWAYNKYRNVLTTIELDQDKKGSS